MNRKKQNEIQAEDIIRTRDFAWQDQDHEFNPLYQKRYYVMKSKQNRNQQSRSENMTGNDFSVILA